MKFLTIDLYSDYDDVYKNHGVLRQAAFQRYTQHLEELKGVLPDDILELARLPGVDDGFVIEVTHDRDQKALRDSQRLNSSTEHGTTCYHTQEFFYGVDGQP